MTEKTLRVKGKYAWTLTAHTENKQDFTFEAHRRCGTRIEGVYKANGFINYTGDVRLTTSDIHALINAMSKIRDDIWIAERDARIAAGTPRV